MKKLSYTLSLFLAGAAATHAQFTAGNIAILETASSTTASNTTATIKELNKATAGQTPVSTYQINGTTGTNALRFSGSATSTGYLANSNDGTLLCINGANTTATSGNTNAVLSRGIGTYNAAGTFNLAATYTGASGDQPRSATTLNNADYYIADQGGLYTNGGTTASPVANFRGAKAFGGVVYLSTASSSAAVIQINTVSAITGGTLTGLPGLTNNASLQDFYMIQSGSNGSTYDVLYTISATSNTLGTIAKYSLVSGSWVANGTYATGFGGFGLAAEAATGSANLYVSTGQGALTNNSVIKLTDAAGYNAAISITAGNNVTLYTATGNAIVKGVAFAPKTSPLPVTFSYFTAAKDQSAVQLSWATATEVNNDRFEIERSLDGRIFEKIGEVKGAGNAQELKQYRAEDASAYNTGAASLYYRLRQVDLDGKSIYSTTREVVLDQAKAAGLSFYPVPFKDMIHVQYIGRQNNSPLHMNLYSLAGQRVYSATRSLQQGSNQVEIEIPGSLPHGNYFIEFTVDNQVIVRSQVIKR